MRNAYSSCVSSTEVRFFFYAIQKVIYHKNWLKLSVICPEYVCFILSEQIQCSTKSINLFPFTCFAYFQFARKTPDCNWQTFKNGKEFTNYIIRPKYLSCGPLDTLTDQIFVEHGGDCKLINVINVVFTLPTATTSLWTQFKNINLKTSKIAL